jgi:hypothetical protein
LVQEKITAKEKRIVDKAEKHERMLAQAENNMEKDLAIEDDAGPAMRAIRSKTGTFIAETVGKDVYSKAQTVTGVTINVVSPNTNEVLQATMNNLLGTKRTEQGATPEIRELEDTSED